MPGFVTLMALVPVFVLVLGVRAYTDEARHGSIVPTLLASPDRRRVVAAKLVVVAPRGRRSRSQRSSWRSGSRWPGLAVDGVAVTVAGGLGRGCWSRRWRRSACCGRRSASAWGCSCRTRSRRSSARSCGCWSAKDLVEVDSPGRGEVPARAAQAAALGVVPGERRSWPRSSGPHCWWAGRWSGSRWASAAFVRRDMLRPRRVVATVRSARYGAGRAHAHLVEVGEQVGGVLVHAVGAGPGELVLAVATREQAHAERAGATGGQQVPHAVAHDDRVLDVGAEPFGRREEQVGVGLRVGHLVARHDRHAVGHIEHLDHRCGALDVAAGGDRPRHAEYRVSVASSSIAPGSGRTWASRGA